MGLTVKLHDHFGILYDSFGITCIGVTSQPIIPEQVSQNVKRYTSTSNLLSVRKVKQRMALKKLCLKRHKIQSSFRLNGVNNC